MHLNWVSHALFRSMTVVFVSFCCCFHTFDLETDLNLSVFFYLGVMKNNENKLNNFLESCGVTPPGQTGLIVD